MGHVGLTPQTVNALGGFKTRQDRGERRPRGRGGVRASGCGCFAIVFEAVPAAITEALVPKPTSP